MLHEKMEQNKKGVRVQPERPPLLGTLKHFSKIG